MNKKKKKKKKFFLKSRNLGIECIYPEEFHSGALAGKYVDMPCVCIYMHRNSYLALLTRGRGMAGWGGFDGLCPPPPPFISTLNIDIFLFYLFSFM